ncbi:MAG: fosmidomycin resistance protein [Haloferacaceae archaeon]
MLGGCRWLALEVKYLDPVVRFYREQLQLEADRRGDREVAFTVGKTDGGELRLRRPQSVPRGGIHTHYAFACPRDAYDEWYARLDRELDLMEVEFGSMRSLYADDPEGNCLEIAGADPPAGEDGPSLSRLFEVVFEVESLQAAERFYEDLGFDVVDRGKNRRRTRLSTGEFDLELWEPQLGLADARGGVHVDVGIEAADPEASAATVADRATKRETVDGGVQIRDPDGHYVTLVPPAG